MRSFMFMVICSESVRQKRRELDEIMAAPATAVNPKTTAKPAIPCGNTESRRQTCSRHRAGDGNRCHTEKAPTPSFRTIGKQGAQRHYFPLTRNPESLIDLARMQKKTLDSGIQAGKIRRARFTFPGNTVGRGILDTLRARHPTFSTVFQKVFGMSSREFFRRRRPLRHCCRRL